MDSNNRQQRLHLKKRVENARHQDFLLMVMVGNLLE